jgi:DNA ligase 1
VQLSELVAASQAVASTRSRNRKRELLAQAIRGLAPQELEAGVAFLAGEPRQDRLQVGPSAVFGIDVAAATRSTLSVREVDDRLQAIADVPAGAGSRTARMSLLTELLGRATEDEQAWLRSLTVRELRQGALEGVLVTALAAAMELPEPSLRRAAMLSGDLRTVARAVVDGGSEALEAFRLTLGVPLQPMLATTGADVEATLATADRVLVDAKLDGARVQVHRDGDEIRVFTRNLRDVTHRVPEVVAAVRGLPARTLVLDGEALALDPQGRPRPFQVTMQRFGREHDLAAMTEQVPLSVRFFDILHVDGTDVLDEPLMDRLEHLDRVLPDELRVARQLVDDPAQVRAFLDDMLERGFEGVMLKDLDGPYEAGRRGAGWRKLKPVHTLDLVVLAAEWGSGRRRGWLSNLHLGARADADTSDAGASSGFVMLGKTFKGLTDETLAWQTRELLARETHREGHVVRVRPELVVEIAVDGLVASPRYPGGVALRFARVKGYRPDRSPETADTLADVLTRLGHRRTGARPG